MGGRWVNADGRVFISYAHRDDAAWTGQLAADLEADDLAVFLDQWDIAPGEDFVHRLNQGLESATAGLIVFGRSTGDSSWVHAEIAALVDLERRGQIILIPVLRGDVPLPPLLTKYSPADFRSWQARSEYQSCLAQLKERLRGKRPARIATSHPVGDSAVTFAADLERRPEGPRRVTLIIGPGHVSARSWYGEVRVRHDGLDHQIRQRLWIADRERHKTAAGDRSTSNGRLGLQAAYLQLGQALGNQFLTGAVAALLEAEMADADLQNAALQVALEVTGEQGLQDLPWETMCLPGRDEPLILHPRTHLYHFVPGLGSTPAMSIPGPLRILAVIASPESGAGELLDYEAELDGLLQAVDPARQQRAQVRVLDWGSAAAIHAALNEDRYHILHISCQVSEDKVILETEDGLPDPVDALRFASDVLVPDRGVPLIVLGGCASPSGRGTGPAGGTLPRVAGGLLAHGVPAVMTIASDGDDHDTIRLATSFYRSLASRQNAPDPLAALSEARRELHRTTAASPDGAEPDLAGWWLPSLHLRTQPDPLFDRSAETGLSGPAVPPGPRGAPDTENFVGRRSDLRELLRVLRGHEPAAIIYGIGGMGKTSLADQLVRLLKDENDLVLSIRGPARPADILQRLGNELWMVCLSRQLDDSHRLSRVAHELDKPQRDWGDQLTLVERLVLPSVRVLLVLDEAEQNMRDPDQGRVTRAVPSELTDPELAAFIDRWTSLSPNARLLVTSRYPIRLASRVLDRITPHHLGPLSRAETRKLMWRLPGLDALGPADRDRAYADVGGHPRALEYVDSLLRGRKGFAEVATQMEGALRARGIADPSAWLARQPRDLDQALAEMVTLIVDDVLVDRLLMRLQSFPLALRLFVAASVFRVPVAVPGLNWAVAESPEPALDPAREARITGAYEQLAAAQRAGTGWVLKDLGLPQAQLSQLERDMAPRGRPAERAGLPRAIETLLDMSLLAEVRETQPDETNYLVHRWTAAGLRYLVEAGLAGLVEADDLIVAHQRAAAYYEWRADIWPDAVDDLLEARHHRQEAGERQAAAAVTVRAAAILFRQGAFSLLRRLATESRPDVASQADRTEAELLYWQSRAAQAQGELTAAEQLAREALGRAEELGDLRWTAICHERLASIAAELSQHETAWAAYQTALNMAHEKRDAVIVARCYQGFGAVAMAQGNDEEAERWNLGALNLCSPVRIFVQEMIITGARQLRDLARARGDAPNTERLALDCSERQAEYHDLEQVAGRSQLQIGELSLRRNDVDSARTAFEAAQKIAGRSRDWVMVKDCHLQLGRTWQRQGMLSRARDSYQRYINAADDMGDRPGIVDCYHQMGELDAAVGDHRGALVWHQRALELAEQLGQSRLRAEAHRQLGRTHLALGDVEAARDAFRQSQQIGEDTRNSQVILSSKLGLAEAELDAGQLAAAEQIYRECRTMAREAHDQADLIKGQMGLATIARRRGDYDDAAHLFSRAREIAAKMGNQAAELDCLLELGITAQEGPARTAAADYYQRALDLAENLRDSLKAADLCRRLGNLYPDFDTRMDWYRRAAETYETIGHRFAATGTWLQIGQVAAHYDLDEAARCCRRALDLTGEGEVSPLTVRIHLELAQCARKAGDHRSAWRAWQNAAKHADVLQSDDLTAVTAGEGGLISQLTGDPARARDLHWQALNLADRLGDTDTVIASCRDLGRLARWQGGKDHESPEYWYRRALTLAERQGDTEAMTACAQQLVLAAARVGDSGRVTELLGENPLLIGRLNPGWRVDPGLARYWGRLGTNLTRGGRPDEGLGFTAASMLAWLEIDFQQAEGQKEWLRRQRAELGGARFAEHLAEYLDASLVAAVLDVVAGEQADSGVAEGAGPARSAPVHAQGDSDQDAEDDQ
jgi:tetratricopeptide (TPR) repeat protein